MTSCYHLCDRGATAMTYHFMLLVSLSQAQDYITAGACLALGLRFAGSANSDAFDCLYEFARTFMKIMTFAGTTAVVSASIRFSFMYVFKRLAHSVVPLLLMFLLTTSSFGWFPPSKQVITTCRRVCR